jgi:hypothetical protein
MSPTYTSPKSVEHDSVQNIQNYTEPFYIIFLNSVLSTATVSAITIRYRKYVMLEPFDFIDRKST